MKLYWFSRKSLYGFVAVCLAAGTLAYGALSEVDVLPTPSPDRGTAVASISPTADEIRVRDMSPSEGDSVRGLDSAEDSAFALRCCVAPGGTCDVYGGECPKGTSPVACPCLDDGPLDSRVQQ